MTAPSPPPIRRRLLAIGLGLCALLAAATWNAKSKQAKRDAWVQAVRERNIVANLAHPSEFLSGLKTWQQTVSEYFQQKTIWIEVYGEHEARELLSVPAPAPQPFVVRTYHDVTKETAARIRERFTNADVHLTSSR